MESSLAATAESVLGFAVLRAFGPVWTNCLKHLNASSEHLLNALPQTPSLADPPRHAAVFYIDEENLLPNRPETGPDEHERRDERTLTSPG